MPAEKWSDHSLTSQCSSYAYEPQQFSHNPFLGVAKVFESQKENSQRVYLILMALMTSLANCELATYVSNHPLNDLLCMVAMISCDMYYNNDIPC